MADIVLIALHYQNENCHPDGKIKIGIGPESEWRYERLDNARRLFKGLREAGIPIIHVKAQVNKDGSNIIANNFIFKQWVEIGAWPEGSWGADFVEGLGPEEGEHVVIHTRNNGFYGSNLEEILYLFKPRHLLCSGVSTAYAVESTVRHATDVGYEVTVVSDACSTATQEQHQAALNAMKLLAEINTVDEVLANLSKI